MDGTLESAEVNAKATEEVKLSGQRYRGYTGESIFLLYIFFYSMTMVFLVKPLKKEDG